MSENFIRGNYNQSEKVYSESESNKTQMLFENLIWLTTEEAAVYLRKSTHAIRQMVYKGKLIARKFDGRLYFKKDELHALIDTSFYGGINGN
jgi:excisionase family DNA binding protein